VAALVPGGWPPIPAGTFDRQLDELGIGRSAGPGRLAIDRGGRGTSSNVADRRMTRRSRRLGRASTSLRVRRRSRVRRYLNEAPREAQVLSFCCSAR
jgi:hypothetical protein